MKIFTDLLLHVLQELGPGGEVVGVVACRLPKLLKLEGIGEGGLLRGGLRFPGGRGFLGSSRGGLLGLRGGSGGTVAALRDGGGNGSIAALLFGGAGGWGRQFCHRGWGTHTQ